MFIGFIGLEARDNKPNDDPAPGRSGPPARQFHEIESSHESYRPIEHELSTTTTSNRIESSDIFSSMSSENVEYHDNIHYYNSHEDFSVENTKSEKLLIDNRSEIEMTDNDGASSAPKKSLQQPNAQSRLALDNSSTHSENSIAASLESKNSRDDRCDLGAPNSRIARYLKLGDRVIEMDFNYSKEQENSFIKPKENKKIRMSVDVSHDVFETTSNTGGLLMGIIYKGKLLFIAVQNLINRTIVCHSNNRSIYHINNRRLTDSYINMTEFCFYIFWNLSISANR